MVRFDEFFKNELILLPEADSIPVINQDMYIKLIIYFLTLSEYNDEKTESGVLTMVEPTLFFLAADQTCCWQLACLGRPFWCFRIFVFLSCPRKDLKESKNAAAAAGWIIPKAVAAPVEKT